MGVDVEMKVRTCEPLTDDELWELASDFRAKFPVTSSLPNGPDWPTIDRDKYADDPAVLAVAMLDRYYGPGYERGGWPYLREMGDWLMLRFGETAEVRYGSDAGYTDFASLQPWPTVRSENDEHYAKLGHLPYRPTCPCDHCETLR